RQEAHPRRNLAEPPVVPGLDELGLAREEAHLAEVEPRLECVEARVPAVRCLHSRFLLDPLVAVESIRDRLEPAGPEDEAPEPEQILAVFARESASLAPTDEIEHARQEPEVRVVEEESGGDAEPRLLGFRELVRGPDVEAERLERVGTLPDHE